MIIDGEKYACEACVRGHRVSNCQHSDRALTHINKKGRPVSQCSHCRNLRKSRSAHVKCDCGERTHSKGACSHTKDGDSKDVCCCGHGGRCSCALKKEHLDPVPESDSDETSNSTPSGGPRRPRAFTTQSDGSLTVFTNGHHKPAVKHNKMAHQCGLPYVVPRAHSIHGPSPAGMANRSVDSLPHTSTIDALHSESHLRDSMVSAQQEQRQVKSEHNSPVLAPCTAAAAAGAAARADPLGDGQLPPLDVAGLDLFSFNNEYPFALSYDALNTMPDNDMPVYSAGLSATPVDWSHYHGLNFNNNSSLGGGISGGDIGGGGGGGKSSYSQPASYSGFDFCSPAEQPGMTTSTSGDISEADDFGGLGNDSNGAMRANGNLFGGSRHFGGGGGGGSEFETSEMDDPDSYRLSTTSSFLGLAQSQLLARADLDALDMDEFLKAASTPSTSFTSGAQQQHQQQSQPQQQAPTSQPLGNTPSSSSSDQLQQQQQQQQHQQHQSHMSSSSSSAADALSLVDDSAAFQLPPLMTDKDDEALWIDDFSPAGLSLGGGLGGATLGADQALDDDVVWGR